jgi:acetolactate synthase-1/2/3 large subunit
VLDTGYFCTVGEHVWQAPEAGLCLGSGQGRYMGIGLPMAIAAAQQDGREPTILAVGDGGIGMFVGELRAAVERRLPLLVMLLSDGGFGSVRTRAVKDGLTQRPLLMGQPSWLRVMEGMGLTAAVAEDETGVADAAAKWDPASGPAFIEVRFDPASYQEMVVGVRG